VGGGLLGNSDLTNYAGAGSTPTMGMPDPAAVDAAIRAEGDRQSALAGNQADAYSTAAGAYGGDRSALFKSAAESDVGRNTQSAIASNDAQAQRDRWNMIAQFLGLSGNAASVGGQTQTQTMQGNTLGTLLGLGTTAAGVASGLGWKPFAAKTAAAA
jgi:hypothetical protein